MNHFMIFTVATQRYGIPLDAIREIVTYSSFTKIPDAPYWVAGLVQTRGQAMPIIDLRLRFETLTSPNYHDKTVIVATKLNERKLLGLVVDTVEDIVSFETDAILSSEGIDSGFNVQLLKGYIQTSDYSILLLDHHALAGTNALESLLAGARRE